MSVKDKGLQKLGRFSFIFLYCALAFFYGIHQSPNWDEEASIDIALGIRPPFVLDSGGRPTTALHYEKMIAVPVFHTSMYEKQNNLTGVFHSVMRDNSNSFLYYGLIHLLIKPTGVKIWLLRLLSVLTAAVNIFLLFQLAHRIFNREQFAWLVVILVCLNPIFFHHAYEIRAYMPAFFFGLLSTYFLTEITVLNRHKSSTYAAYFLSVTAGFLFHYFLSAVIAGQMVWLIYMLAKRGDVKDFKPAAFVSGALISLSIVGVWFWIAYRQGGIRNMNLLDDAHKFVSKGSGYESTVANYFKQLFISFKYLIGFNGDVLSSPRWRLNYFSGLVMLSLLAIGWKCGRKLVAEKGFMFISCILISSLIFSSLMAFKSGHFINFLPRYLVFILPVFVIWLSGLLFGFRPWQKLSLLPKLTAFFIVSVNMMVFGLLLSDFLTDINNRQRTDPDSTYEKTVGSDLNALSNFGTLVSDSLAINDTIVYSNWKLAQQVNFFLRNRNDLVQMVNPTGGPQEILIFGSRKRVFKVL